MLLVSTALAHDASAPHLHAELVLAAWALLALVWLAVGALPWRAARA